MRTTNSAIPAIDTASSNRGHELAFIGPLLYFHGLEQGRLQLATLLISQPDTSPPDVTVEGKAVLAEPLYQRQGLRVFRYRFSLPAGSGGSYCVNDKTYEVAGISEGDLLLAYVSCNGQEEGDFQRASDERNPMWQRLADQHLAEPYHLLLQGGDQLYADEALQVHPAVQAWAAGQHVEWPADVLIEIRERLHDFLFEAYCQIFQQRAPAWVMARVPSLCMWDDHDICDGWGSLFESKLDDPVGRVVFEAAREFFLLFQAGCTAAAPPSIFVDRQLRTLTWAVNLPGLLLLAPDLRSERRPQRILGPAGWEAVEEVLRSTQQCRVLMLSSVPLLGPRLSLVEAVMQRLPGLQKYEDDLRDQWQSRAHRQEWRRMLRTLLEVHERDGCHVAVVSGEIHLATRATMATDNGPLHQLIASGIAHPAPTPWYGRILGALARLGEAPLAGNPIRLFPLPGQRSIYTSQRNYLIIERRSERWSARWELEASGTTNRLELDEK